MAFSSNRILVAKTLIKRGKKMDALERIKEQVQSNKVILYMKGTLRCHNVVSQVGRQKH
ncbi:MAG: hypothetical protein CM15mP93_13770 [Thiotrichaceae bacterium]|nr:MAG: hypothetical protein CM15mP93_13770 [Thiotrichaceae bacterium]